MASVVCWKVFLRNPRVFHEYEGIAESLEMELKDKFGAKILKFIYIRVFRNFMENAYCKKAEWISKFFVPIKTYLIAVITFLSYREGHWNKTRRNILKQHLKDTEQSLIIREMFFKTTKWDATLYPLGWLLSKKLKTSDDEDMGKLEPPCLAGGRIIKMLQGWLVIPQKFKPGITVWPFNSTSGHKSKRIESRDLNRYLYTNVHSSIIHYPQRQKQL